MLSVMVGAGIVTKNGTQLIGPGNGALLLKVVGDFLHTVLSKISDTTAFGNNGDKRLQGFLLFAFLSFKLLSRKLTLW